MNAPRYGIVPYNPVSDAKSISLIEQTAALLSAYVTRNAVLPADLPQLIRQIHAALSNLENDVAPVPAPELPTSSAIAASIRHDRIVSFIDGKAYKSLKRHLTAHGMTPGKYRGRYGLPSDYPMVSPGYAELRSRIAREIQTGFKAA